MQRILQLNFLVGLVLILALCHSSEKEDLIILYSQKRTLPINGRRITAEY